MKKFLIVQTAFIGDVVLATPLIEKLRRFYPDATLDVLVRRGNEGLLKNHPHLRQVLVWDKKGGKYRNLWRLLRAIRRERYDEVVNCQRFAASGLLTAFSGAKNTVGFSKNPLSWLFSRRLPHHIGQPEAGVTHLFGLPYQHEVARNLSLIEHLTDTSPERPRLYPTTADYEQARQHAGAGPYVCLAPTSVWYTKQWPAHKWVELMDLLPADYRIFLLGAPSDHEACEQIRQASRHVNVYNLAGQLNLLASAALMQSAQMNYVNDSAPLHFASAVNAPVTAVFCSTLPSFGFTPLSDLSRVVETPDNLPCRPCGLHGHRACPEGHFKCAEQVSAATVLFSELPLS